MKKRKKPQRYYFRAYKGTACYIKCWTFGEAFRAGRSKYDFVIPIVEFAAQEPEFRLVDGAPVITGIGLVRR